MNDFFSFLLFFYFLVLQRIAEIFIARRNEKWLKKQGAMEFGKRHYKFIVMLHVLFFVGLLAEKVFLERTLSPVWPIILGLFVFAQILRVWTISSLGMFWNTKILVIENAAVVRKGPYRFLKHPNYFIVAFELVVVPLLFNAFYTALLFTFLNVIMMMIRIPEEEKALRGLTEYEGEFEDCNRFIPRIVK